MTEGRFHRRSFLKAAGVGAAALAMPGWLRASLQGPRRPNIVLIMADDLGYECLGSSGCADYKTPRLDELASNGMRFTHCYSQPLCTPTRVQLMTGQYNFRNYSAFGTLPKGEFTFAHMLKQAGYATCVVGKWQLAVNGQQPGEAGFDEHCMWQVNDRGSRYDDPVIETNGEKKVHEGRYGPDVFCDYAADFMQRSKDKPFFLYFPMALPHSPFEATPHSGQEPKDAAGYFKDMVEYTDFIAGRIVDKVAQLGLADSTLVIFTGDNGTHRQIQTRMVDGRVIRGEKGRPTNGGTHVPMIAAMPGAVPAGQVCDELVDFTDFMPTFAGLARTQPPAGRPVDGQSFLPHLTGAPGRAREWTYCYYDPRWAQFQKSVFARDKRWKLYDDGRLMDLSVDELEKSPIAAKADTEESAHARQRLQAVLDRMRSAWPPEPIPPPPRRGGLRRN